MEYSFVNGALVERGSCNPELFLSEYLAKLDNFTIADVEVLLQVDLNFRDQFLSWIPLRGSLVRRNIVRVLRTLVDPKNIPRAVAMELRDLWNLANIKACNPCRPCWEHELKSIKGKNVSPFNTCI